MTMLAPAAIESLYRLVKSKVPQAVMLGITGDARHVADGGYHISRSLLLANGMSGDYSIQQARDKLGNPDYSSAIDIGFGGYGVPLIKAVGQRMLAAGKARDPRVACLREMYCCGPSDSSNDVIGWDYTTHSPAYTDDMSHRGHLHISIAREYADDFNTIAGVADVIAGTTTEEFTVAQFDDIMAAIAKLEASQATQTKAITDAVGSLADKIVHGGGITKPGPSGDASQDAAMAKLDEILAAVKPGTTP